MTDWQDLVEFMHDPKTQEAVARYAEPEAEERGEAEQVAMWEEAA